MQNSNKKRLTALILVILSTVLLITFQANAISPTVIDDIEYTYDGMTAEKAEQIVNAMFGNPDDIIQPFNILCIFGHSKQPGSITTTEHNYYSANPRCKQTISNIEYCTRSGCDYFVIKSETVGRIICH